MNESGQPIASNPAQKRKQGFTLVELMVVVVIIGVLAAITIPAFIHNKRSSTASRLANDFRKFSEAYLHYNLQEGDWPADVNRGVVPPEMAGYFIEAGWTMPTAIGGNWDYDAGQFGVTAAISINSHTADLQMVAKLDGMIDDGDVRTGMLRAPQANYILFVLEE